MCSVSLLLEVAMTLSFRFPLGQQPQSLQASHNGLQKPDLVWGNSHVCYSRCALMFKGPRCKFVVAPPYLEYMKLSVLIHAQDNSQSG